MSLEAVLVSITLLQAPLSYVQSNCSTNASNGTQASLAFASAVDAGSLLVIVVEANALETADVVSVTDSVGSDFHPLFPRFQSNAGNVQAWYALSADAGPDTLLATFSAAIVPTVYIHEYRGPAFAVGVWLATDAGITAMSGPVTLAASTLLFAHCKAATVGLSGASPPLTARKMCNGDWTADAPITSVGTYTASFQLSAADSYAVTAVSFASGVPDGGAADSGSGADGGPGRDAGADGGPLPGRLAYRVGCDCAAAPLETWLTALALAVLSRRRFRS